MLEDKIRERAHRYVSRCEGRSRHISFIVRRRKILAVGWNRLSHAPRLARMYNEWATLHSEIAAIARFKRPSRELRGCVMYNVRIDRWGEFRMSRPCPKCRRALKCFGIRQVYYTDDEGGFRVEYLERGEAPRNLSARVS